MPLALLAAALLAPPTRPNIVYVMADDLGYGEVGCFGQKLIPTPNIDRLADQGIRLTRFYSPSPVCAPTRASVLTGKHQGHAAIRGNKEQGGFGPNDPEGQFPLPKSERTIAELLRKAGYATAIVGKWGLGGTGAGENPLDHGFDRFYGYLCQRRAHNYYPPYLWSDRQPDLLGNPVYDAHQKIAAPLATEAEYYERYTGPTWSPMKLTSACLDFIDKHTQQPFFLYYVPTLPHVSLQAPKEWVDKFPREWDSAPYLGDNGYLPNARPHATYAAMINYLDFSIGQIVDELDRKGLTQNTLIVVTSDNGATFNGGMDAKFFQSNSIYRAGKMSLYEGGIRVPFVAKWPGRVAPGTSSEVAASGYDTFASLCHVAGIKAPKTDGVDWSGVIQNQPAPKRDYLYFEYPEATSMQCVMLGNFKAIRPTLKKEHVPNKDFPLPGVDTPPTTGN